MLDPTNDSDARDLAKAAFNTLLPHPDAWPVDIAVIRMPRSGNLLPILNFQISIEPFWFELSLNKASRNINIPSSWGDNTLPDVVETVVSSPHLQCMIESAQLINDREEICDFRLRKPTLHEIAATLRQRNRVE